MNTPNVLVMNTIAKIKKNQLNNIFQNEPHFYKAIALKEMGYDDEFILTYLDDEIKAYNEFQDTLLQELKKRKEDVTKDVQNDSK